MSNTAPRAWTNEQARLDTSWIQRLSADEVAGFDAALAQAKATGKSWLAMTADDFPLPEASREALKRAFATAQGRWGICLLKGFPVDRWSEEDAKLAYWGMGLHTGVARTQNPASQYMNDVRDEGGEYKAANGRSRGYNTKAGLDFHMDSGDIVGLLCRRTAKTGGESLVASTIAVAEELGRRRPDLLNALKQPFYHHYQGSQDPLQPPYYACPIIGSDPVHFAMRVNRKNIVAAQRDFPELPRVTAVQWEAIELLEEIMADPRYCFRMKLEQGDLQLVNNYVVVHSRTPFEDFEEADAKRHLLRLWLSVPDSQPLPADWAEYFIDTRPGSVRGGLRGSQSSAEFAAYEERQAKALGMAYRPWAPVKRRAVAPAHAA
ncbi:MAG: TauD/TfdA family dioxygenase [Burkholderiaceae bacterium]|nr:TauD/TfdA family dioxygenase [Burkholderiaceae bacterium]